MIAINFLLDAYEAFIKTQKNMRLQVFMNSLERMGVNPNEYFEIQEQFDGYIFKPKKLLMSKFMHVRRIFQVFGGDLDFREPPNFHLPK